MTKVKEYVKSIAAFWAALAVFAAAVLTLGISFPSGVVAVLSIIAASGVVAGVVAGSPTQQLKPDQLVKQAAQAGVVVAGAVVKNTADVVEDAVQVFIQEQARAFPQPARKEIEDIAATIPTVTANVIDDLINGLQAGVLK